MLTDAPAYGPTRGQVIDHFERISSQLRRTDARLERNEWNRTEPGHNWAPWFRDASRDLRRAREEFAHVVGRDSAYSARQVLHRLDRDSSDLLRRADQLASMDRYNRRFGSGWGSVLDNAVRTVEDALWLLRSY